MIKNLIVNLATGTDRDPARDYALTICEAFNAHIVGMAFLYEHFLPGFALSDLPAKLLAEVVREQKKTVDAAVERFHAAATRSLLSAEHIVDKVEERVAPAVLASMARQFDLSVIMQSDPEGVNNDSLIEALLFDSGRPVNLVPYIQRDGLKLDRVVCCWDGSRPAARAINDAMPFLAMARAVDLFIIVNEKTRNDQREVRGVRMAKHLASHDIEVDVKTTVAPDIDIASAILAYVADSAATMIVMGAYGHSRTREFILGGATRGILQSMTVPVLMSH
jgi:nucleotide-binding universal stress UspA family protein